MALDLGAFCYNFDPSSGGEATNTKDKKRSVSWRLDPEESLSDWTIVVTSKISRQVSTYHVHKNFLGAGVRRSQYFARLFRRTATTTFAESSNSTSTIELEDSAATAFGDMLDFLYSSSKAAKVTTESAVALRYLSIYFGIEELFQDVNTFIEPDLTPLTSLLYLQEAEIYMDEKIVTATVDVLARDFTRIDNELLSKLPPELFQAMLSSSKLQCESKRLSCRVKAYVKLQQQQQSSEFVLDRQFLSIVTHPSIMPEIHPDSAVFLLKLATEYHPTTKIGRGGGDSDDGSTQTHSYHTSSPSLKDRCIQAASETWKESVYNAVDIAQLTDPSSSTSLVGSSPPSSPCSTKSKERNHPANSQTKATVATLSRRDKKKRQTCHNEYAELSMETKNLLLENALAVAHQEVTDLKYELDACKKPASEIENSALFDLSTDDLLRCIGEVSRAQGYISAIPELGERVRTDNLSKLKSRLVRFEEYLWTIRARRRSSTATTATHHYQDQDSSASIGNTTHNSSYAGDYIYRVLKEGCNITFENHENFTKEIQRVVNFNMSVQGGSTSVGNGTSKLENLSRIVKLLFPQEKQQSRKKTTEQHCIDKAQSYRVWIYNNTTTNGRQGSMARLEEESTRENTITSGRTISFRKFWSVAMTSEHGDDVAP
mmetsp:Transcript_15717/g.24447  ORF Transcript_15717/g.24447 Transcript_15717/m.24447 type:complete len:658 (-) Transcript_15717:629-2602(-)|eukprot:CAMPEP_0195290732 /NCGR_PEP_ID=MMETSP0707-20130614/6481_1 /TAXON_ID=33640 /ORGANISM="Asterionellopsis glacialis, Strain CCMP134" /LENGTH=657 /DNA_ID=CAMNT_0040350897 /DNA_START=75 /DNA_END=2048 /DNA_ORIENTATION=+